MNKKFMSKMLVVCMVIALAVCAFCVTASADDGYVYTAINGCYLKAHPYDSAENNLWVDAGANLNLVDSRDGWYQVGFQGHNGWIPASNLNITAKNATGTTASWKSDGYYTTTTAAVNLRSGPSTSYSVYLTIPAGSSVYLHSHGNGWAYIYYGSQYTGYVTTAYLSSFNGGSSTPAPAKPTYDQNAREIKCYTTTTAAVNLRSGPSTAYEKYTVIPGGSEVYIVSTANGWSYVYYGSQFDGYVSNSYLSYFGNEPAAPAPSKPGIDNTGLIDGGCKEPTESGWYAGGYNKTTTAAVNLRSGPGTQYTKLTVIPAGASVYVKSYDAYNRGWAYVYYGSQFVGYVSTDYLR